MSFRQLAACAATIAFTFGVASGPTPAAAKANCKELSASQCRANTKCTYVKGYTTSTGSKVSAYCRNKGGNGAAAKSNTKKTATKKPAAKKAAVKPSSTTKKTTAKKPTAAKKTTAKKAADKKKAKTKKKPATKTKAKPAKKKKSS